MSRTGWRTLGVLALSLAVLAAGAVVVLQRDQSPPATSAARGDPSDAAIRHRAAAPSPSRPDSAATDDADDLATISALRRDEAVSRIAEARRLAADGNFPAAEAALAEAAEAAPTLPELGQARADIARLETPEGQLALHLQRARLAIDHGDEAAAEAALDDAARLQPDAPPIAQLRADLRAAREKQASREARIAEALGRMREAVARRDFGAANSALNEAERIDVQDPTIRRARSELARARGEQTSIAR